MKAHRLAIILGLVMMWHASPARAGGVIIECETTNEGLSILNAGTNDGEDEGTERPESSPLGVNAPAVGVGLAGLNVVPLEPPQGREMAALRFSMYGDFGEDVAGLDGEDLEYADVGCGGAQAASGPVGFLPFAVAGLALLFRRRRD